MIGQIDMLKTKSNKKKLNKKILLIITICLILFGLLLFILETFNVTHFVNKPKVIDQTPVVLIDNNTPTTEQKAAGEIQKKASKEVTNNDLGISITSINTSIDPIQIRSIISGAVSNSGNCTLELIKGDIIILKTSETYALPSSSTCKGFDINKSELSIGLWQIKLTVNMGSKESSITDSFNLE